MATKQAFVGHLLQISPIVAFTYVEEEKILSELYAPLLEGGRRAFLDRERRYRIHSSYVAPNDEASG